MQDICICKSWIYRSEIWIKLLESRELKMIFMAKLLISPIEGTTKHNEHRPLPPRSSRSPSR